MQFFEQYIVHYKNIANWGYVDWVSFVNSVISLLIGLLTVHFVVFAIVGIFAHKKFPQTDKKLKYGVIIPARNEEKVVVNLIKSIQQSNYPQDKLTIFVIAHNCTDKTAEVSRDAGAVVYEYTNPDECTMGYAFKYLFSQIHKDYDVKSFDGFFLFNADNVVMPDYFDKMNDAFVYYEGKQVVTSFRNTKNFGDNALSGCYGVMFLQGCIAEARGRTLLGCSTRVQGTGYVIGSDVVKDGVWPYVTLTEDWEFSSDQILQGNKIKYCDEAVFYDEQPTTLKIMWRQRLRWARGHLLVTLTKSWPLFKALFKRKTKNRGSVYDIWVNILPISIISGFLLALQLIMLGLCPVFNENILTVFLNNLKNFGINFALLYIFGSLYGIVIMIVAGKRLPKTNFRNKLVTVLTFPLFVALTPIIAFISLFCKNLGWKTIPHKSDVKIQDIKLMGGFATPNDETAANNESALSDETAATAIEQQCDDIQEDADCGENAQETLSSTL